MTNNDLIMYGGIAVVAVVVILYVFNWWKEKNSQKEKPESPGNQNSLVQIAFQICLLDTVGSANGCPKIFIYKSLRK